MRMGARFMLWDSGFADSEAILAKGAGEIQRSRRGNKTPGSGKTRGPLQSRTRDQGRG